MLMLPWPLTYNPFNSRTERGSGAISWFPKFNLCMNHDHQVTGGDLCAQLQIEILWTLISLSQP
jgi:hypothetical protein